MQGINTPGSLQRGVIPRSFEVRKDRRRLVRLRTKKQWIILAYIRSFSRGCGNEVLNSCLVFGNLQ